MSALMALLTILFPAGLFADQLGRDHVYGLPPGEGLLDLVPAYADGRILFGKDVTFSELTRRFDAGARLVEATGEGAPNEGTPRNDGVTPMFVLGESGELTIVTAGLSPDASAGHTMIGLTGASAG